jgi:AcrR family transcriptional regulator
VVRSATELREEILTAAREEFAQYGLAGARIDRIASAAKASKERLYAHFGDKESLFRHVVAADHERYFATAALRPEAVAEFVGLVFDLSHDHPEMVRMVNWAQLEGFRLEQAPADAEALPAHMIGAITEAQAAGRVDPTLNPPDLLAMLFALGMAWAHFPSPRSEADVDPDVRTARRAAAVAAAQRIITPS